MRLTEMSGISAFLQEGEKPEPNMGMKIMAGVDEPEARFRIPRAPVPKKFPPGRKYHELPKWSEKVVMHPLGKIALDEAKQTLKDYINNFDRFIDDLKYRNPNHLEKMAEDAANWYLTKNKR
jgi:hypothetical protein